MDNVHHIVVVCEDCHHEEVIGMYGEEKVPYVTCSECGGRAFQEGGELTSFEKDAWDEYLDNHWFTDEEE